MFAALRLQRMHEDHIPARPVSVGMCPVSGTGVRAGARRR